MTAALLIEQLEAVPPGTPVVMALSPGDLGPALPCVATDTVAYFEGELFPDFGDPGDEDTPAEATSVISMTPLQNMCHELRFTTLPTWAELVDRDKEAAVKFWDFVESQGHDDARDHHPARFKDEPLLVNLTRVEACDYSDRTGAALAGVSADWVETALIRAALGQTEWERLQGTWPNKVKTTH